MRKACRSPTGRPGKFESTTLFLMNSTAHIDLCTKLSNRSVRIGPACIAYARRIGAKVAMGSKVKKSTSILLHRSGFSTRRPCEVPGMTANSPSGTAR